MTMIIDGTNGLTFNNNTTQASSSKVLQVVNATYSTQVSTTTSTYVDTGLTATITPLFATSKILVIVDQGSVGKTLGDTKFVIRLVRNSTTLFNLDTLPGYTASTISNAVGSVSTNYLDSPATTSATTYKTQFNNADNVGTTLVQWNGTSTITLMEIAA